MKSIYIIAAASTLLINSPIANASTLSMRYYFNKT